MQETIAISDVMLLGHCLVGLVAAQIAQRKGYDLGRWINLGHHRWYRCPGGCVKTTIARFLWRGMGKSLAQRFSQWLPDLDRRVWILAGGRLLSQIGIGFTLFYATKFFSSTR